MIIASAAARESDDIHDVYLEVEIRQAEDAGDPAERRAC
jgi:hypothetical protein